MFDYDPPEEQENEPADYSGLIIGLILSPVFFVVTYLANADMALGTCIALGMVMLAIKLRWYLRKHVWFLGDYLPHIGAPYPPSFHVSSAAAWAYAYALLCNANRNPRFFHHHCGD